MLINLPIEIRLLDRAVVNPYQGLYRIYIEFQSTHSTAKSMLKELIKFEEFREFIKSELINAVNDNSNFFGDSHATLANHSNTSIVLFNAGGKKAEASIDIARVNLSVNDAIRIIESAPLKVL